MLSQKNHIVEFFFFFFKLIFRFVETLIVVYCETFTMFFSRKEKKDFQDIFLLMDFLKAHLLFSLSLSLSTTCIFHINHCYLEEEEKEENSSKSFLNFDIKHP